MSGMSGSGKTTFAKRFTKENGLRYLCVDDFYAVFNGSEKVHEHEFEVWMAFFQAIHLAEQDGVDVIVDTNAPTPVDRIQFINWFPNFDEHHLIFITARFELCMKNNASRSRVVPPDVFKSIHESIQLPKFSEDPRWTSISYYKNDNNERFVCMKTGGDPFQHDT